MGENTNQIDGRVPMTVAEYAASDLNGDVYAYWYNREAAEFGLECWAMVDGVDAHTDGKHYDVWFASGKCMTVTGDTALYVPAAKLGAAA